MKTARWFAVAAALTMFGVPDASAQVRVDLEITPFTGGTFFLADPPARFARHGPGGAPMIFEDATYDDAWTLGTHVGVRLDDRWALEAMFAWMPTTLASGGGVARHADVNGYMYGLTGLFYLPVGGPVTPFVGLGVGGETFDYEAAGVETHSHWMGNVAAGLSVPLTGRLAIRFEARDCFARFASGVADVGGTWQNDLMLTVGMGWRTPLGR